jgi:hypothetical protein
MLFKRKIFLLEKVQEQNEGGNQPISKEKKRKENHFPTSLVDGLFR